MTVTFTIIDYRAQVTVGGFNISETIAFVGHIVNHDKNYNIGIVSERDFAEYTVNTETEFDDFFDWIFLYELYE